jgi:hypothetical protein
LHRIKIEDDQLLYEVQAMLKPKRGKTPDYSATVKIALNEVKKVSKVKKIALKLLEMVEASEWQTRHAAENSYCPYCAYEVERYDDQTVHHKGCKFVKTVREAREILEKKGKNEN